MEDQEHPKVLVVKEVSLVALVVKVVSQEALVVKVVFLEGSQDLVVLVQVAVIKDFSLDLAEKSIKKLIYFSKDRFFFLFCKQQPKINMFLFNYSLF